MTAWLNRTTLALAVLVLAGAGIVYGGVLLADRKMARVIKVDVKPVEVRTDAAHIDQGRYLFNTRGCADCHGSNGAGKTVIDSGGILVVSPNISRGTRSAVLQYQVEDWVRTLRHGVKPNGRPVMIMPSEDYNRLTDDDVASIIAYVRQLQPVPGRTARVQLPLTVKLMYAVGRVKDAAQKIDHTLAPSTPVAAAVTVSHGAYVANTCINCHGAGLSGGRIPGGPPEWPPAANLTPGKGSAMVNYPTADVFIAMLRSGRRPDGSAISPLMPFGSLREMNEVDARALHAYLKALAPRDAGQR
jgi:mono/diheme cytochrome c family protein